MPELPEVETIVRRLASLIKGKSIDKISVLREKSFAGDPEKIAGMPIVDVSRRAKLIRLHLPENHNLLVHLKMTGQLIYLDKKLKIGGGHPTADWVQALPSSHTRIIFDLSDDATLYFNDMRVFGWVRALNDEQVQLEFDKYGPDIVDDLVTPEYLLEKFSRTARPVKLAIMDNAIVSGVGNIYASDALNLAQINPAKPAKELSVAEVQKLLASSKFVINLGIELGGATIDNYKHVDGFSGSYQDKVLAYGREGEKCKQCGGTIVRAKIGGRSAFFCPDCQV